MLKLLTTIPKSYIRKSFGLFEYILCCCRQKARPPQRVVVPVIEKPLEEIVHEEVVSAAAAAVAAGEMTIEQEKEELKNSKVLWIRGYNRLIHQVCASLFLFNSHL